MFYVLMAGRRAQEREGDVHFDFPIVTSSGKHEWVGWIPDHDVTARRMMSFNLMNQYSRQFVPNEGTPICRRKVSK